MDLYERFKTVSVKMRADFDSTGDARHNPGKGTNREDIVRSNLERILPRRYGLGKGEIVSAENRVSNECDIVIFDAENCPRLLSEPSHALFPIEATFGVIQVKSVLSSSELRDDYAKIRSAKELRSTGTFTTIVSPTGMEVGLRHPHIFGAIVAFEGGRSLDTVAAQIRELNRDYPAELRPDLIVVLDEGVVGSRRRLRIPQNQFVPPLDHEAALIRRTLRHTWLRFCLHLVDEMSTMTLPDLDLERYLRMPELIGKHRVSGHDRFARHQPGMPVERVVRKLSASAVEKIIAFCSKSPATTYRAVLAHQLGAVPMGLSEEELDREVFEFNPNGLPPIDPAKFRTDASGRLNPNYPEPAFVPMWITIDGQDYAVDASALGPDAFVERDIAFDEVFS